MEYSRGGFGLFEGCCLYMPCGIYRFIILCILPVYIGVRPFSLVLHNRCCFCL